MNTGELEWRWCDDIGMYAMDRPINDVPDYREGHEGEILAKGSCDHRTDYCNETCYNIKLYRIYKHMLTKDVRNEVAWQAVNAKAVAKQLKRKRKQVLRVRGCTRGENIKDLSDIFRWREIALETPETTWWIPSRVWRNPTLNLMTRRWLSNLPNVRVDASLDPSNTKEEWEQVELEGWNIMFYGDNELTHSPYSGKRMFKCPKTWKGLKDHCNKCKGGCLSDTQSITSLKEH